MGDVVPFATARDLRTLIACKSKLLSQVRADRRFSHAETRIYSAALDYVHRGLDDRFGMLWPSVSTLARDACCARRTVQTALTKFIALKYLHLVSDRRGGRTGRGSSATAVYALPGVFNSAIGAPVNSAIGAPVNSAIGAPVNSAIDASVNSAIDAPQSFREEPMEEISLRDICVRRQTARRSPRDELVAWVPRAEDCEFSRGRGYEASWIADQAERFRDHHLSKGSALSDIDAAWRNWQRIAHDRDECPPDVPRYGGGDSGDEGAIEMPSERIAVSDDEWRRRLEAFREAGAMTRHWPRIYGLPPTHPATDCPRHLREDFGFA